MKYLTVRNKTMSENINKFYPYWWKSSTNNTFPKVFNNTKTKLFNKEHQDYQDYLNNKHSTNDLFVEMVYDYIELIKHTGVSSDTLVQDNPFKIEDPYHPKECIYDEDEYINAFANDDYRDELYGYISLDSNNNENEYSDYENDNLSDFCSDDEDGEWVDIS